MGRLFATIKPSASLVWAATGTPLGNFLDKVHMDPGQPLEVWMPHTDQDGFLNAQGDSYKNWFYTIKVTYERDGQRIPFAERQFQIPSALDSVDLALIPSGDITPPEVQGPPPAVISVNGMSGTVNLTKASIGLSNVDNTSDMNKPVSIAQAAAIQEVRVIAEDALELAESIVDGGTQQTVIDGGGP
jgi:hypothetical protein